MNTGYHFQLALTITQLCLPIIKLVLNCMQCSKAGMFWNKCFATVFFVYQNQDSKKVFISTVTIMTKPFCFQCLKNSSHREMYAVDSFHS